MHQPHSYRFGKRIAAGGTGEVYRGEFLGEGGFSRPVAIKLMRTDLEHRAEFEARLRDEARMVSRVRHPSVVRMEDLCTLDGRVAVVMEYIDGADLSSVRDRYGALPPRAVAELLMWVSSALYEAYITPGPDGQPMQIVHRDIKPENIAIDVFGAVKVLDFGAARARFVGREAQTLEFVPGTLPYMAPERFLVDTDAIYGSLASDLWALGATAAEMALGLKWSQIRRRDKNATADQCAEAALHEARLPPDLSALILSMLAQDPDLRPDAEAVAERAGRLASSLPGPDLRSLAREAVKAARSVRDETEDPRMGRTFTVSEPVAPQPSPLSPAPSAPRSIDTQAAPEETVPFPAPAPRRGRPTPLRGLGVLLLLVSSVALALVLWGRNQSGESISPAELAPEATPASPMDPLEPEPEPTVTAPPQPSGVAPSPRREPVLSTKSAPKVEPSRVRTVQVQLGKDHTVGQVWLDPGRHLLPAAVPPGHYVLMVEFITETGPEVRQAIHSVDLSEDSTPTVKCYLSDCRIR